MTVQAVPDTHEWEPEDENVGEVEMPRRESRRGVSLNRPLIIGSSLLLLIVAVAVFAPLISRYDPSAIDLSLVREAPSWSHPFGTDSLGRDLVARVLTGARISLVIAGVGMLGSIAVGVVMGMFGGMGSRRISVTVERLIDIQLAFPYVLLAIAVTSAVAPSIPVLILLMVFAGWAAAARVVRSVTLREANRDYVAAAELLGVGKFRVAARHVFPSVLPTVVVIAAMQMAAMIVFEATLSFLGMGIQPPTPSWGGIMLEGKAYLTTAWWMTVVPGMAIVLTSTSLLLLGDGLQRHFDRRGLPTGKMDA